ncbi:MAG: LytR C-terminal domain-containing protein [Cryobacterium sp.]|nr:LytR C-terminal domain-containing protein [Cryobacterium sp.]
MANFPKDRFDELPDDLQRVGAHRAPARRGRGWIGVGWSVLATLVLVVAGVFALSVINDDFRLPFVQAEEEEPSFAPIPSELPDAEPVVDPEVSITVLNGTPMAGLATTVGDELVAKGWTGASLGIGSRANAADRDIDDTIVYYSSAELEGAARGLVIDLGVGEVRLSADYPNSPITIVLGADFRLSAPTEAPEG